MNRLVLIVTVAVSALFTSCAPSLSDITIALLDQGKNDEALARMKRAILLDPKEPSYHKLKGIAHYNRKEYSKAVEEFNTTLSLDDEDDQAAYYLAATYENLKQYDKAIRYYRLYNELTFYGEYRDLVEARINLLYRQQMEAEAKRALQNEKQLDVAKVPTNTVAILYFQNKGGNAEFDPLQKGLAEMIITDLSKVRALKVVERIRLQKLVEELNLSETDLVDQKTAPRLGKLLGAYRLVKGSFFELTKQKMNIDAFVARTRTGTLDVSTNVSGNIQDFFRLEKDLVFKIIDEMKITLTDEERESILEIPTENFFAFLQYSRGLELEDRGLYTQAFEAYSQAAQADPNFSQAKSNATSAKKAEQLVGPTTSSSTAAPDQQQSGTEKSTASKGTVRAQTQTLSIANTPSSVPSSNPANRPGGGSIIDMLNNIGNNFNNNLNPGTGNQNQPPPVVRTPLPTPPLPPGN